MPDLSAAARRLVRPALVCVALLLLLPAAPAGAAGTGGLEVTPNPPVVDGKQSTNFRVEVPGSGERSVSFTVRNITGEQRSARLYAAEVTRSNGNLQLGTPGSSPFAALPDRTVTLEPGEMQTSSFTVRAGKLPDGEVMAAVVLEVRNGSVVQRASTLIYVDDGPPVPLPLLLAAMAAALLLIPLGALAVGARRRARSAEKPLPTEQGSRAVEHAGSH